MIALGLDICRSAGLAYYPTVVANTADYAKKLVALIQKGSALVSLCTQNRKGFVRVLPTKFDGFWFASSILLESQDEGSHMRKRLSSEGAPGTSRY